MALSPVEQSILEHTRKSKGGIEPNVLWRLLRSDGHEISIDEMLEAIHNLAVTGEIEPCGRGTPVVRVKGQPRVHPELCDCEECLHDN